MEHTGAIRTFVADGTDFRHAVVVHDPCAVPELADASAHGGNAAAGFACDADDADLRGLEIDAFLGGRFSEVDGVGRRAAEDGRTVVDDGTEAGQRGHPSARECEAAELERGFKRGPKTEERPEGEGEEDPVLRRHTGGAVDLGPVPEHPVPALRSVEPTKGPARAAARAMAARVAADREGEVRSVGRIRRLIGDEIGLRGEGETLRKRPQRESRTLGQFADGLQAECLAEGLNAIPVERIGLHRRQQGSQLRKLALLDFGVRREQRHPVLQ